MPPDMNLSISAAPTTGIVRQPYYDLPSTVKVMNLLLTESAVNGFEVQNLAEWNKKNPPWDDVTGKRLAAWKKSLKYSVEEVATQLQGLPVLSVHGNRDIGICLCSSTAHGIDNGMNLIHESLALAEKVDAGVCVFHLWDTWKEDFDVANLENVLSDVAAHYPHIKASVENIPTHFRRVTPFDLIKNFEWITLDIRWALMYDELEKFASVKERIANIHLRGELRGNQWVLNNTSCGFYDVLDIIKTWGYSRLLTLEPEGGLLKSTLKNLVAAMVSLRAHYAAQE